MMMMMKSSLPGLATDTTERKLQIFLIFLIFRRAHDSRIYGLNLDPRPNTSPSDKKSCLRIWLELVVLGGENTWWCGDGVFCVVFRVRG
jgi:hypothetical protein